MARKVWFNLGIILILMLALGGFSLAARQAQAQKNTPEEPALAAAALGSDFTYQGLLTDGGSLANGVYDFKFTLYDAASGGNPMGSTVAKANVDVTDGLFTVTLDFGNVFDGTALWLKVMVRPGSSTGAYTPLNPRQALTAAPYALSLKPGAAIQGNVSGNALTVQNSGASGPNVGVSGESASSSGQGIYGLASASSGFAYGVKGESWSTDGRGLYGVASASSGDTYGVYGITYSPNGKGVYGSASAASGTTYGVRGQSASTSGIGVKGYAIATSGTTYGVEGQSISTGGSGVFGWASSATGFTKGVHGWSDSSNGAGVLGYASSTSGINYGVYGWSRSPNGYGGYFEGDVHVVGDLSATGTKPFKIDHPLDPANRYLYHFAQESPQVQNVYNGVITLDVSGEAVVNLPEYFSVLNTDPFRYQLTPIGAPMP
ncbi:MAG: hypothetical protein ACE5FD_09915, partial [Anaerolineae bacterium]